jgi:hypothetical protein
MRTLRTTARLVGVLFIPASSSQTRQARTLTVARVVGVRRDSR